MEKYNLSTKIYNPNSKTDQEAFTNEIWGNPNDPNKFWATVISVSIDVTGKEKNPLDIPPVGKVVIFDENPTRAVAFGEAIVEALNKLNE